MAIDKIYEGKTRDEIIELVYTFHLQNTNGRETHDEMFKLGIEACYDELCVGECSDENGALPIPAVSLSVCSCKCNRMIDYFENTDYCHSCGKPIKQTGS